VLNTNTGCLKKLQPKHSHRQETDRQLLYDHWASLKTLFKFQPLDDIEEYFGPKVAFFFAWLGYLVTCLLPMALIGSVSFFVGPIDPSFSEAKYLQI